MDIAQANLTEFAAEEGKSFIGFDPDVASVLTTRPWPGNVRQLLNVIRNIVVLHDGPLVTAAMLPTEISLDAAHSPPPTTRSRRRRLPSSAPPASTRDRVAPLVGTRWRRSSAS